MNISGSRMACPNPRSADVISEDPADFFDERLLSPADSNFDRFAEPGRPLVWPGQFLISYKRQRSFGPAEAETASTSPARLAEEWLVPGLPAPAPAGPQVLGILRDQRQGTQRRVGAAHDARSFSHPGSLAAGHQERPSFVRRWRTMTGWPTIISAITIFAIRTATPVITLKDGTQASTRFQRPRPTPTAGCVRSWDISVR